MDSFVDPNSTPQESDPLLFINDIGGNVNNDDVDNIDYDPKMRDLPPSLIFIISNEFCERFSYFGMKTMLPLYLVNWLSFTQNKAMTVFHFFIMAAYFFSLFGGVLSDNVLGRYRTILYLSVLYCVGSFMVVLSSVPFIDDKGGAFSNNSHFYILVFGLLLIAMGTGGIKPCVSSFGADQIIFDESDGVVNGADDRDDGADNNNSNRNNNRNNNIVISDRKAKMVSLYFNIFYLSINFGCISILITPIVRSHFSCFNHHSCYPLAFSIPTALLIGSTIIFWAGKSYYCAIGKPTSSNSSDPGVVFSFISLILYSSKKYMKRKIVNYLNESSDALAITEEIDTEENGFFECCRDKWSDEFIEESRKVLKIIKIFVPITIYWSLYDQQASLWVFQAALLDGRLRLPVFGTSFVLMPEQMGLINASLVLLLIPFFTKFIYPNFPIRPLKKLSIGLLLTAGSFVAGLILQIAIAYKGSFEHSDINERLVCTDGCISIAWQFPQYLILTVAEVLVGVTGLEYAYCEAPDSMRAICQSAWLVTVAFGNMYVIIFNIINPMEPLLALFLGGPLGPLKSLTLMPIQFFLWILIMAGAYRLFNIISSL